MKKSVYMLTSREAVDGGPIPSSFVRSQARSIEGAGWKVLLGLIDDRTSFAGVLRNALRVREQIMSSCPGVVHAQYGSVISLIAAWTKRDVPLIISFCGADLLGSKNPGFRCFIRDFVARRLGLVAAQRAAVIIVKSENLYRELPGKIREKAVILPNSVDTHIFRPMEKATCRQQLGWSQDERIVLFNASKDDNRAVKNPSLAIAAVNVARQAFPNVGLKTISDAPYEEVAVMMNAADCLLLTSVSEGSPNVVKEAMACDLPVVAVPCGDVIERVKSTVPGAVCPYNALFLGEALLNVLRTCHRSNGGQILEAQGLTGTGTAQRLLQLYRAVQDHSSAEKDTEAIICVG